MAKVAVVTGGGSGVGRATALLLARHVGNIHVADPSEDTAQEVARASEAAGGSAVAHAPDVANPTLWRRMLPVEMIGVAMMAGQIPRSPSVFPP